MNKLKKELIELIGNLKKGQTLHYWHDIADRFDKIKKDGETDYKIADEYEAILDELENRGIIKYKKDEDGNDNIIVKLKDD